MSGPRPEVLFTHLPNNLFCTVFPTSQVGLLFSLGTPRSHLRPSLLSFRNPPPIHITHSHADALTHVSHLITLTHPHTPTRNPTSPLGREWFSSHSLPSNPHLPHRGGGYPSPYPLPWTWRGRSARCQTVLFGPRWLPEGLRALNIASKIGQDSPTWLQLAHNMPPRGSNTAPRRLQVAKEPPKEAPERSKSIKHLKRNNVFGLLAVSLPMGF